MLLRVSGEASGAEVDVHAVTDGKAADASGVAHAAALVGFADAEAGDDDQALGEARDRVLREMGPEALVDTAAVAANFERMVRVADSTGIPVDLALDMVSEDVREALHLENFASAANTPRRGALMRLTSRALRPFMGRLVRWMARES